MKKSMKKSALSYDKPRTKYFPLFVATILILAVSASLWYVSKEYAYHRQTIRDNIKSENGVWDLRAIDFKSRIDFLDGEVEYIPGALLSPEEFSGYKGEVITGYVPDDLEAATARMLIIVTPGRYMLSGNSIDYNERIYINGEWRLDVGRPGLTKAASVPGARYMKFEVEAPDGVIEIIRQSSNFVHKENCAYAGFWIGSPENMLQMIALQEMPASIIVGLYVALFFMHLIVWLLFRGYRPNLWFSMLCFAGLVNAGFTGRKIYWSMFPAIPWGAAYRAGCIAGALAGALILLLINDEFPGLVHKWVLRIFAAAYAAFCVFFLSADTVLVSYAKSGVEILIAISAVYFVARFAFLMKNKNWRRDLPIEQVLTVFGIVAALIAFLHDILYYNSLHILPYEIADVGALALVLFQTAAMVYGAMRQYSKAQWEARAAQRAAEELAAKTEFYHRMAHDLLTPLTKISTNVQIAQKLKPDDMDQLLINSQIEIMKIAGTINAALENSFEGAEG